MTSNPQIPPSPLSVVVVAPEGAETIGLLGIYEAFTAANRWRQGAGRSPLYTLQLAAVGAEMRTESGLRIGTAPLDEVPPPHTLVVGGRLDGTVDLGLRDEVLRLMHGAERLVSICAGAFVLGETGVLDGRRCTTHWLLLEALRERFPLALVEDDVLYTEDDAVLTSAGATAGIDLALHLIRRDGSPRLALAVARSLVVFAQRTGGQSQFGAPLRLAPGLDERLRRLVAQVSRDPSADHRVPAMARSVGMSARHFARVFHTQTGETPAAFVRRARVEAAQRLLAEDDHGLAAVAKAVGLGSEDSLRRAFLATVGVTPGVWRQRFGMGPRTPALDTADGD